MALGRSLPLSPASLLGRETDLADLGSALLAQERLIVLTGPPGVGKTRLALAVAEAVADWFDDGVAWVDLTPVRNPDLVVDEIAHGCGLSHAGAIADRETLVVLDNCEHLLDAAPAIAELLAEHSGLKILATSRERLHIAAEHEWPLPPLPVPELDVEGEGQGDLKRLATNPAIALVLAQAPAYVTLTPRTARPLTEIIQRLDGLPLALEFAAARLRVFTPSELAFRLEHSTDDLVGTTRDSPARHRDLRAAITWSHDLLPPGEQAIFRRLSVFEGSWTLAEAEAVCAGEDAPDVLSGLESLLDKSLIRRIPSEDESAHGGPARFGMLISLREYGAEQLEQHDERASVRARHAAWFTEVARSWEATIGTGQENMIWHRSQIVRGDLEVALTVVRDTDAEATLWLSAALSWYWYTRGAPIHAEDLAPRESDLETAGPDAASAILVATGVVAFALGDLAAAEERLATAYAICEDRGDERRVAFATAFLGHVARETGRYEEARAHYRRARGIYEAVRNDRGIGWAACDLGLLEAELGNLDTAEVLLREALGIFDALDYPWAVAVTSCGLAVVLAAQGDAGAAGRAAARAFELHSAAGDVRGIAQSLEALAEVALARGAASTAARLLGAGAAQRQRAAARATAAEQDRIHRATARTAILLGTDEAAHEHRAGESLGSHAVTDLVTGLVSPTLGTDGASDTASAELTARQREVAELVADGRTNRQISRELGISEKTTELHLRNAMQRLGVHNRAAVAAWIAGQPR